MTSSTDFRKPKYTAWLTSFAATAGVARRYFAAAVLWVMASSMMANASPAQSVAKELTAELTSTGKQGSVQESGDSDDIDQRLQELGYELPELSKAVGIYKRAVVVDKLVFLSGHISIDAEGQIMTGKVGADVDLELAQQAAERSALAMLASLKEELGSLNKIKRLVKTTGMVNCTPDFTDQSLVINGCSEVFRDLFGADAGVGARAAVGMSSLPKGSIVEIEAIFELK